MRNKTVDDNESISTKISQSKAVEYLSSSSQQMYKNKLTLPDKRIQLQFLNMITMQPIFTTSVVSDKVLFVEDSREFVIVSDYHYRIMNQRFKSVMIGRNCQPNSQLLFWCIRKPGTTLYLESMDRFQNKDYQSVLHFNITKYNPGAMQLNQSRDVYLQISPQYHPIYFMTIENSKKAMFICENINNKVQEQSYKQFVIFLINITKSNKIKNIKQLPSAQHKKNGGKKQQNRQEDHRQYLFQQVKKIQSIVRFHKDQFIIKIIISQYGQYVTLITNYEMYQLQFEDKSIKMKGIKFLNKLSQYLNNKDALDDQIKDISYQIGGLKLIFVTRDGCIGQFVKQNIQYCKQMTNILQNIHTKQQLKIKSINLLISRIVIETQSGLIILCKLGEQQIIYLKTIVLAINDPLIKSYRVSVLQRQDQLILQRVMKGNKNYLQILTKNIYLGNQFKNYFAVSLLGEKIKSGIKISNSKCNKIVCVQKEHSISFYKFNQKSSSDINSIEQLFTKTFFQKPNNISFNPYGSNIIVTFRQFVKFFKFQYKQITHYYTYNVRNVCYAGFSQSGQYIMMAVNDRLYFINPYHFETERVMQAYGDIKLVNLYDDMLYLLQKNKINKNNSQTLFLHIYIMYNNQYKFIKQIKLDSNQALYTSNNKIILASNKQIHIYLTDNLINQLNQQEIPYYFNQYISKKIILSTSGQYPTCINLCQCLGILIIGTNQGRLYQYRWPFNLQQEIKYIYTISCSASEIVKVQVSPSFKKIHVYCKNSNILQMDAVQYIDGQQMPSIYMINPELLVHNQQLKNQFVTRQLLYSKYTPYVQQQISKADETIDELNFIYQKNLDDIDEQIYRSFQNNKKQQQKLQQEKQYDTHLIKQQQQQIQNKFNKLIYQNKKQIQLNKTLYQQQLYTEQQQYQKKMLQISKQANKYNVIFQKLDKQQNKQIQEYLQYNSNILKQLIRQGQKQQLLQNLQITQLTIASTQSDSHLNQLSQIDKKRKQLNKRREQKRQNIQFQLQVQQKIKQKQIQQIMRIKKTIANYKDRKNEFDILISQTNQQIKQLHSDKAQYENKKSYLKQQLVKKQKIIESKQKQTIKLISSTSMMKKLKQIHQFQLKQNLLQFEPIEHRIKTIDDDVQKMNKQILKQHMIKSEIQKQLLQNKKKYLQFKTQILAKKNKKFIINRKFNLYLSSLVTLFQQQFNSSMHSKLIHMSLGQNFVINQQFVKQKNQNQQLMRKKQFIRKQIQQSQKRQYMLIHNKTQIICKYHENAILVQQLNALKHVQKNLKTKLHKLQLKLLAQKPYQASQSTILATPLKVKKAKSVLSLSKKLQLKLTPFQKYQQQNNESRMRGVQTQKKLLKSSGSTLSALKSIIKTSQISTKKSDKIQQIRDKIRSFINPEIVFKKNIIITKNTNTIAI